MYCQSLLLLVGLCSGRTSIATRAFKAEVALRCEGRPTCGELCFTRILPARPRECWEPQAATPGYPSGLARNGEAAEKTWAFSCSCRNWREVVFINTRFPLEWYDILDQLPDLESVALAAIRSPMRQCVTFGN